jgi:hypothetical protein
MKSETGPTGVWTLLGFLGVLLIGFSAFPSGAEGQGQGNNAVYKSASTCCQASPAFIDASVFATSPLPPNRNFCGVLAYILNPLNGIMTSGRGIIDARGLNSANTSMTCTTTNPSPWAGISNPPPSTILLPATGGPSPTPIIIPSTWILPNNTRLIGQGDNDPGSANPLTMIQVSSTFSGSMIQFGSSGCPVVSDTPTCYGISVENLTLNGMGESANGTINGIVNQYAQDGSYVDHVNLYKILGTGLSVSGTANDSGPYSNITYDTGGLSGASSTICASINGANGLSGTHGIHGLTCIAASNDPPAAVLLDSSNNSIEDVRIAGFYDGIRVGANANAQSNVLVNILGDTEPDGPTPVVVVHIFNSSYAVSDLSIMGVYNVLGGAGTGQYTIQDYLTGTMLQDKSVGIYALGESPSSGIYSRYTTSPNAATWAVGSNAPPVSATCSQGSLYSCIGGSGLCTSGTTAYALWDCVPSGSGTKWTGVK